jgi:hypothetical protein
MVNEISSMTVPYPTDYPPRIHLLKQLQSDTSIQSLSCDTSAYSINSMGKIQYLFAGLLLLVGATSLFAGPELQAQPSPTPTPGEENSLDLFSTDTLYTLQSSFKDDRGKLGDGGSLYNDFSYDHRFLITGNWYFRAGVEYERFDFTGTENGLPDHLQAAYGHVAFEYLVHDHAGAGIELDPGVYFQDKISGDAFDIPGKAFVTFPLKKDKIYGVIGLGWGFYQNPPVAPGGGLIWLFTDKMRLEGVFPKPALVYDVTDDFQLRVQGYLYYESYRTDNVVTPEKKLQLHNAVVQYNEDRVGLQAKYTGIKPFRIVASAGYTFFREFDFFRAHTRAKLDPAPYFELGLEARF